MNPLVLRRRRVIWRRMRRSRRGVAAVVGTLLALLVFLSIFGIFLTSYLPLWMTDNESAWAVTVENQFGQIDHTMELLYLENKVNWAAQNPVTMSSASVPVFSQPTVGALSFSASPMIYTNVTFHMLGSSGWQYRNVSTGTVGMNLGNRYYVPVTLSLEDGAVVLSQGANQQSLTFQPSYVANFSGTHSNLYLTLFATYGNNSVLNQQGTAEVYTTYSTSQAYSGVQGGTPVYLNLSTYYPCAWYSYWNQSNTNLNQSGFPTHPTVHAHQTVTPLSPTFNACSSSVTTPRSPVLISVYFPMITYFSLAVVTYDMAVGSTTNP